VLCTIKDQHIPHPRLGRDEVGVLGHVSRAVDLVLVVDGLLDADSGGGLRVRSELCGTVSQRIEAILTVLPATLCDSENRVSRTNACGMGPYTDTRTDGSMRWWGESGEMVGLYPRRRAALTLSLLVVQLRNLLASHLQGRLWQNHLSDHQVIRRLTGRVRPEDHSMHSVVGIFWSGASCSVQQSSRAVSIGRHLLLTVRDRGAIGR
jgi:hypothetical protein